MMRRACIAAGAPFIVAAALGAQDSTRVLRTRTLYEDLQLFSQVMNQIRTNHPDSVDSHRLVMSAIEAMVRAADPHSYVIPALRLEAGRAEQWNAGKLWPVPLAFDMTGGTPVVVSVAPGSGARRQGVLPGDALIAIGGKPVLAESSFELEIMLAGSKGSSVPLRFERRRQDGARSVYDVAVRREKVEEASAIGASFMLNASTGYVRVITFVGERIADDLHKAVDQLTKQGMQGLVLDLRDNGGGSVREAAGVAGEFLPKGSIVYTSSGRKAESTDTGRVSRSFWRDEARYPVVVMINAGSASASELVAGALQDHDRALIYGRPSFGKSLMMQGFPMTDGSTIMLVVGSVQTPCGRRVQREYRGLSYAEYYRQAGEVRDTTGRPPCQTRKGRTVYGGGGIYPDVVSEGAGESPVWLDALIQSNGLLTWAAGVAESGLPASAEQFSETWLTAEMVAQFRTFAREQGVQIPETADATERLRSELMRTAAYAKWGDAGAYRVEALLDTEVTRAVGLLSKAAELLK